jgi:hypothetical protein
MTSEILTNSSCPANNIEQYQLNLYKNYRSCQNLLTNTFTNVCFDDSDCIYTVNNLSYNFTCNLLKHECLVPNDFIETQFLQCLINLMNVSQKNYLKQTYNATSEILTNDTMLLELLIDISSSYDCINSNGFGLNYPYRTYYIGYPATPSDGLAYNAPFFNCPDTLCIVPEHIGYALVGLFTWFENSSSELQCTMEQVCNWNTSLCNGKNASECSILCNSIAHFCGLCEDGLNCIKFDVNETQCNFTSVCILPNGTTILNISEAECSSIGECSYCPPQCDSNLEPSACRNLNIAECLACYENQLNCPY